MNTPIKVRDQKKEASGPGIGLIPLILINSGLGIFAVTAGAREPNPEIYLLIDSLKENDTSCGYGDYWDSNLVTYLSGERVILRPVEYRDGDIYPFEWLSCDCWYRNNPREFFLLVGDKNRELISFADEHPPDKVMKINGYTLLYYSNQSLSHISTFNYIDQKLQFIFKKLNFDHS